MKNIPTNQNQLVIIILFLAISLYLFSSFFSLSQREFSEGEDEIISVNYAIKISHFTSSPDQLLLPFVSKRLPFAYLFISPIPIFLPSNEVTLRLPNILFGTATILLIFLIAKNLFDNKVALLSILLYVCSGVFAINRLTIGISNCVFFICLSFYFLTRSLQQNKGVPPLSYLTYSAFSLLIASLTFQDATLFAFSALFIFVYVQVKRGVEPARIFRKGLLFCGVYFGGMALYYLVGIAIYSIHQLITQQPIDLLSLGSIPHWLDRLKGAAIPLNNNFLSYLDTFTAYNSIPYGLLLCGGILLSFNKNRKEVFFVLAYILPHMLAWAFFIKGNILEHPLFILPFLTVLAAKGCIYTVKDLSVRSYKTRSYLLGGVIIMTLAFSYLANNAYFNELDTRFMLFQNNRKIAGHGKISHVGFKTAGYIIRKNTSENDAVWIEPNMSGAISYYADRRVKSISDISISDVNENESGVIVLTPDSILNASLLQKKTSLSKVVEGNNVLLNLYFMPPKNVDLASTFDTKMYDHEYDKLYSKR